MAICGASAALAISSVLPKSENHERDTVFTVIGVTALSTIAMIIYPLIIALFHLDHAAIGVFLGGTIHDVAPLVGAGFSVSDETGNVATFTKLLRVAMLLPVVVTLSFHLLTRTTPPRPGSNCRASSSLLQCWWLSTAWASSRHRCSPRSKMFRAGASLTAIAALGMKTSLKAMAEVGGRAIGADRYQDRIPRGPRARDRVVEILKAAGEPLRPRAAKGGNAMSKDSNTKSMSMIVTKGTLDWAYPPFILATTAAAMGIDVTMFFTFYGLGLLKKKLNSESLAARQRCHGDADARDAHRHAEHGRRHTRRRRCGDRP